MRTIVETTEAEGLDALLGKRVSLWCVNYIYTGSVVANISAFWPRRRGGRMPRKANFSVGRAK